MTKPRAGELIDARRLSSLPRLSVVRRRSPGGQGVVYEKQWTGGWLVPGSTIRLGTSELAGIRGEYLILFIPGG